MQYTKPINLGIAEKLKNDKEYRRAFFRASATDSIALQIRDLRKRRELKQAELAVAADMKQSAVSRIEQAEYSAWSFNTLSRVADALDARLIITFQPMEVAVKEFESAERGVRSSKDMDYISTGAVPNHSKASVIGNATQQAQSRLVSVAGSKMVMQLGAIAHA